MITKKPPRPTLADWPPASLTVRQVAQALGVSTSTVYAVIERGQLMAVPHLSPLRVSAAELQRFQRALEG